MKAFLATGQRTRLKAPSTHLEKLVVAAADRQDSGSHTLQTAPEVKEIRLQKKKKKKKKFLLAFEQFDKGVIALTT